MLLLIVDWETSTPVEPKRDDASKEEGAPDPLKSIESFSGSNPVIIESLSNETILVPSKLTSTMKVSASAVAE